MKMGIRNNIEFSKYKSQCIGTECRNIVNDTDMGFCSFEISEIWICFVLRYSDLGFQMINITFYVTKGYHYRVNPGGIVGLKVRIK